MEDHSFVMIEIIWAILAQTVFGFNLEPRIAIVKTGNPGSYFGYSVAQHQVVDRNSLNSIALIGAPRDDSEQPGTNRSGTVWQCPLTQSRTDCTQIRGIVPGSSVPPRADEIRNDQWLGVAVSSQGPGGKVIVCAHRYTRRGLDYRWGQGQCFTLTNRLQFDETWEPCRGRDTSRAHEEWGYCQAGTSAILLADKTALIGTPGPYTWRGTVFAVSTSDDFLFRDKTHYHSPVLGKDSPVDKYSYLGMAVTAGNFLPTSRNCGEYLSYAVGAPRANGTGQVVIFVKCHSELLKVQMVLSGDNFASQFGYTITTADVDNDGFSDLFVGAPFYYKDQSGGAVYYYKNSENGLDSSVMPVILEGRSPESRFGFALSSAGDVNNDGYEDLVVGAPYDNNGAVFLYQGSADGIRTKPSQVIRSQDIPGPRLSTFGYSLSGGMDMDLNNHSDVVVGAYQSDSAVILRARPVIDIITWFGNKTVRINPSKLGCDMDPTSEEVCFEVESCFQIRNFPTNIETTIVKYKIVAEIFGGGKKISRVRFTSSNGELAHSNEKIVQVRKNNLDGCFKELVYLKQGTADIRSPIKFLIEYSLGLDEPTVQGGRIPNINQFPILNRNEASKELEIPFYKDCGDDDECQSELSAEVKLFSDDLTELSGNILELGENREILVNVTISNLGDPAYFAWMNLNFSSIFSFVGRSDDVTDILCDLQEDVSIRCNLGNPYLKRTETIQFKLVPIYSPIVPKDVMFTTNITTTSDNIIPTMTTSKQFQVVRRSEVSIRGSVRPESILYGGHVVGESAIRDIAEIGSRVLHTFHVVNDGPWQADNVNVHIDWPYQVESGAEQGKWLLYLTDAIEISPPGVGKCFINPRNINFLGLRRKKEFVASTRSSSQSKHKSGATSVNSISETLSPEKEEEFYTSSSIFSKSSSSSRKITYSRTVKQSSGETSYSRFKRELEETIEPDSVLTEDGFVSRVVVFDCGRRSAKCFTISCSLPRLARRDFAVIKLRSRVWNSTLVEDYPHIDSVVINARARLEMSPDIAAQQLRGDDETTVSVVAFPDGLSETGMANIPIWVMVVSIMAGLFVVVVITLILWKFGFFERKRVSDVTQSVKISKQYPLLRGDEYIT